MRKLNPFARHIAAAIALKLVLLVALWWFFVRPVLHPASTEDSIAHFDAGAVTSRGSR